MSHISVSVFTITKTKTHVKIKGKKLAFFKFTKNETFNRGRNQSFLWKTVQVHRRQHQKFDRSKRWNLLLQTSQRKSLLCLRKNHETGSYILFKSLLFFLTRFFDRSFKVRSSWKKLVKLCLRFCYKGQVPFILTRFFHRKF